MSILFVGSVKPVKVGANYQAGKLSAAGLYSQAPVMKRIKRYLLAEYNLDTDKLPAERGGELSAEAEASWSMLFNDVAFCVLMADYSQQLSPGELCKWDDNYLEACYAAAIELNPKLAPVPAKDAATGDEAEEAKAKKKAS